MFLGTHMHGVAVDHKSIKKVNFFLFVPFCLWSYYYDWKNWI